MILKTDFFALFRAPCLLLLVLCACGQYSHELSDREGTPQAVSSAILKKYADSARRSGHSAVWDPATRTMIVFGGAVDYQAPMNTVSLLVESGSTTTWVDVTTPPEEPRPDGRRHHTAVWDARDKQMIVFGGWASSGILNDLWSFRMVDGVGSWSRIEASGEAPPSIEEHSAVWDEAGRRMIVFGGGIGTGCLNDLWILSDGGGSWSWSHVVPEGEAPESRYGHTAVWDEAGRRMIVFAGRTCGPSHHNLNDVWFLFDTGSTFRWEMLTPAGEVPDTNRAHSAVWIPTRNEMVVFGGSTDVNPTDELWRLKVGEVGWSWELDQSLGVVPLGREDHTAVWDGDQERMLIYGGEIQSTEGLDDVWEMMTIDGRAVWRARTPSTVTAPNLSLPGLVWDEQGNRLLYFGLNGPDGRWSEVWELVDTGMHRDWIRVPVSGTAPTPRYRYSVVWDAVNRRAIYFGGEIGDTYSSDVWVITDQGTHWSWAQVSPTGNGPTGRADHSVVWDQINSRMIVFGGNVRLGNGYEYTNEVWILSINGSSWSWNKASPTGTPPSARRRATAIWQPEQSRMIVFGGYYSSSQRNDLWGLVERNGSWSWEKLSPTGTAPSVRESAIGMLDREGRFLFVGGHGERLVNLGYDRVWVLTQTGTSWAWSSSTVVGPTSGTFFASAAAWDHGHQRLYAVNTKSPLVDTWQLQKNDDSWDWSPIVSVGSLPPSRKYPSTVWDRDGDRMIVFGGTNGSSNPWILNMTASPRRWDSPVIAGFAPPFRRFHSAVWDETHKRMLVFGGYGNDAFMNDVWVLSDNNGIWTWANVQPSGTAPTPRAGHSAVWDKSEGRMIVFGGQSSSGLNRDVWFLEPSGDTWAWTQVPIWGVAPTERNMHAAAWDDRNGRMIVFGGAGSSSNLLSDVAVLQKSGSDWSWVPVIASGDTPQEGSGLVSTWDDESGILLVSSNSSAQDYEIVMELSWDGEKFVWKRLNPLGELSNYRSGESMAWDPQRRRAVIYRGIGEPGTAELANDIVYLEREADHWKWRYDSYVCETEPPTPLLAEPLTGTTLTSCGPTLSWTSPKTPDGFEYVVFVNGEAVGDTLDSHFSLPPHLPLKPSGNTWQVRSSGCSGCYAWSESFEFSVDGPLPSCSILSMSVDPSDAKMVVVDGVSSHSDGCFIWKVEISTGNGEWLPVPADPDYSSWQARIPRETDGLYTLSCRVVGAGGAIFGEDVVTAANNECSEFALCNSETHVCSVPVREGLGCFADNDGCTNDFCTAGVCQTLSVKDCSALSDQCNTGICVSKGPAQYVCSKTSTPNEGSLCAADSSGCTVDHCKSGVCRVGTAPDCSSASDQCNVGVCQSVSSSSYVCVPSGTPRNGAVCDTDFDGCTSEKCQGGQCLPDTVVPCPNPPIWCSLITCRSIGPVSHECVDESASLDGTDCNDFDKCTYEDRCLGGKCLGVGKSCSDGFDCSAEYCDSSTGSCVILRQAELCDDGNPCTNDYCVASDGVGCVNEKLGDGTVCSADKTCFRGSCELVSGNDTCANVALLTPGMPLQGIAQGHRPSFEVPEACFGSRYLDRDAFYKFFVTPGYDYEVEVTPTADLDVAVAAWKSCSTDAECLTGVDEKFGGDTEVLAVDSSIWSGYVVIQVIVKSCEAGCAGAGYSIKLSLHKQEIDPETGGQSDDIPDESEEVVEDVKIVEDADQDASETDFIPETASADDGVDSGTTLIDSGETDAGLAELAKEITNTDVDKEVARQEITGEDAEHEIDTSHADGVASGGCNSSPSSGSGGWIVVVMAMFFIFRVVRRKSFH